MGLGFERELAQPPRSEKGWIVWYTHTQWLFSRSDKLCPQQSAPAFRPNLEHKFLITIFLFQYFYWKLNACIQFCYFYKRSPALNLTSNFTGVTLHSESRLNLRFGCVKTVLQGLMVSQLPKQLFSVQPLIHSHL